MSENEEDFKIFIINELKEQGYKENTDDKSVDSLKEALSFQKKLNTISAKHADKKEPETKKSKIQPIDMSKENAASFSKDIMEYFLKENAGFDERIIDDERFKTNVKLQQPSAPTMILRDKEGRCY